MPPTKATDLNIADLRRNYTLAGLTEERTDGDALRQFAQWFDEAAQAQLSTEINAMTLATATPDGKPSARIVLLKGVDERGFVFYTNYESRKGMEIAENPRASLVFFWQELERQVRIDGVVEKTSPEETARYFQSRPLESRIGAWVSHQSSVIGNRAVLETRYEQLSKEYADGEIAVPPYWGGYRVVPECVEFWQGRPSRLHDRLLYTKTQSGWRHERLSP
jgi:pyridoxamine 5'-phosphate oxidase